MIALLFALIIALAFSYLAFQNSQPVTLQLQDYVLPNIPLYIVAITFTLIGVLLSFLVNLGSAITSTLTMFSKDQKIRGTENELRKFEEKIRELEVENARLRGARTPIFHQSTFARPNLFQRLRHRISV